MKGITKNCFLNFIKEKVHMLILYFLSLNKLQVESIFGNFVANMNLFLCIELMFKCLKFLKVLNWKVHFNN